MIFKMLEIYNRKRLFINAITSVCQVLTIGLTYFILYSVILKTLGADKLGTWSLILSTTSVANIANLGFASSLVKFIASCSLIQDEKKISNLIHTGLISITVFIIIISSILYFIALFLLPSVIPAINLQEGLSLLPLSLVSLSTNAISGIFLSTIDGFHHSSLRSIIYIVSSFFFLVLSYLLLSNYGLYGVAIAQLLQSFITLILSVIGVKIIFRKFKLLSLRWDKLTFRMIFKYSVNFQVIGLFQLLYDPTTKFLLSKYGNLTFVGFYELAFRLIIQIRALIVSANQVVVPSVASSKSIKNDTFINDSLYPKVFNWVSLIAFPMTVSLIMLAPFISYYWFGYYENYFIFSLIILSIGYFFNLLSVPAYFSSMGIGDLKGNLISQIVIAFINVCLGFFLGHFLGGWGVVISWSISIIIGSLISLFIYHKKYDISFNGFLGENFYKFCIYSTLFSIISLCLYYFKYVKVETIYLLLINMLLLIIFIIITLKEKYTFIINLLKKIKF